MLNTNYDIALNLMCSTDEELAEIITSFVTAVPSSMQKKIQKFEKEDSRTKENKIWAYSNDGTHLSLSVGDSNNSSKDYMSMCVRNVKKSEADDLGRHSSEILLGYITLFLNSRIRKEKAVQLTYNFYLKKAKNNYYIEIKCDRNNYLSDRMHLIEMNGLKSLVERFANGSGVYPIKNLDTYFATQTKKANI